MSSALLPIGLAFIMFSLGLGLTVRDFGRVLTQPTAIALGLLAQVILLPLTAFALTRIFALDPTSSVGLMVLAACPGGVTAGMVTRLALGDTALSITLTALTSMLAFLTVPLIIGVSLDHFLDETAAVQLPAGQAIGGLFVVTLMPVAIGLLLRARGRLSEATRGLVHRAATVVFIAIVVFTFVDLWEPMRRNFATLGFVVLSLNVITMATGALIASGTRLNTELEGGSQAEGTPSPGTTRLKHSRRWGT